MLSKLIDWFLYDGNIDHLRAKIDCSNGSYDNCTYLFVNCLKILRLYLKVVKKIKKLVYYVPFVRKINELLYIEFD